MNANDAAAEAFANWWSPVARPTAERSIVRRQQHARKVPFNPHAHFGSHEGGNPAGTAPVQPCKPSGRAASSPRLTRLIFTRVTFGSLARTQRR
jgi:hypothetical protein